MVVDAVMWANRSKMGRYRAAGSNGLDGSVPHDSGCQSIHCCINTPLTSISCHDTVSAVRSCKAVSHLCARGVPLHIIPAPSVKS